MLVNAGIDIKIVGGTGGLGKLHHKMMVIDDQLSIFGSFNYTKPANKSNDENIVIVGDLEEENCDAVSEQKKIAKGCRKEIERIIRDFA